ncbi:hypothetical protein C8Q70DRAFT_1000596 [Cubamyces menziesii]|nr:hypothetical protein C8Q70DRAFT_1000596 [Cubamyces menziesii]
MPMTLRQLTRPAVDAPIKGCSTPLQHPQPRLVYAFIIARRSTTLSPTHLNQNAARMSPLTEEFASRGVDPSSFTAVHDGVVHNPLGAAAYVYEKQFAKPILRILGLIPSSVRLASKPSGVVLATTGNIEDDGSGSEDGSSVSSGELSDVA